MQSRCRAAFDDAARQCEGCSVEQSIRRLVAPVVGTIESEDGRKIERDVDAERVLDFLFDQTGTTTIHPRNKRTIAAHSEDHDDDDEPKSRRRVDKDELRRLIKDSDLSVTEIAERVGCSKPIVYTIRAAMKRDGELG